MLPRYRNHNFLILFHFRCEARSLSIGIALARLAFWLAHWAALFTKACWGLG
jgi:hypothetical protein